MEQTICCLPGCDKKLKSRRLCGPHYRIAGEEGWLDLMPRKKAPDRAAPANAEEARLRKNADAREAYAKGGAHARAIKRKATAKIREQRIPLINKIKMDRGCIDCGYNAHPAALHFDHRDPSQKEFGIAKRLTVSLEKLMAEIDKCDVRCANCHAIRSVNEGHLGRPRIDDVALAT